MTSRNNKRAQAESAKQVRRVVRIARHDGALERYLAIQIAPLCARDAVVGGRRVHVTEDDLGVVELRED